MMEREPLVFGNPDLPLTVGNFVAWLERQFEPHVEEEKENREEIRQLTLMLTGNGEPKSGMKYKVDDMWQTSQRISGWFTLNKMLWVIFVGALGAIAAVISILHNLGFV